MHHQENGVELPGSRCIDVSDPCIADPAIPHDLDRVAVDIHGNDLETHSLQLQGVASGSRTQVEHPAPAEGERPALDLRQLVLLGAVELLDTGRLVFPEVGLNCELGLCGAVVVVEQGAPEGRPPCLVDSRIVQCVQGTTSNSVGAITRTTGSRPTVSSQYGVRLYHQR